MKLKQLMYVSMFAAVVAAFSVIPPIFVPFTPVPITAQTLGVMLAGAILGARLGFMSMGLFVILVAIGVPVLSGGRGGLAILFGPSGGYILSWPIAAFVIGYLVQSNWEKMKLWKMVMFNLIGGVLVIYACGITYLSFVSELTWLDAAKTALVYIPGDTVKAIVSGSVALAIRKALPVKDIQTFKQAS
ncbi:biotin transporter BioY [Halalkalibacter urbisdiaboli]|uniref:biotin transporter BioY n=1 Tax=Halalkalibacter urbisdiaboli TaxID=1960589 RepID=UPI000B435D47|nr:biotin transporter BioY [Halalkalibacter urbisdiaboli]